MPAIMARKGTHLWLPPKLVLDEDMLMRLFDFHKPPEMDTAQFCDHVRQLPQDDLQELVGPWLESLPSNKLPISPVARAHCVFLRQADVDDLWEEFCMDDEFLQEDFEAFFQLTPARDFIAFMTSVATSNDCKHLSRKAKLLLSSRNGKSLAIILVHLSYHVS
jgi:hypothetical protein